MLPSAGLVGTASGLLSSAMAAAAPCLSLVLTSSSDICVPSNVSDVRTSPASLIICPLLNKLPLLTSCVKRSFHVHVLERVVFCDQAQFCQHHVSHFLLLRRYPHAEEVGAGSSVGFTNLGRRDVECTVRLFWCVHHPETSPSLVLFLSDRVDVFVCPLL